MKKCGLRRSVNDLLDCSLEEPLQMLITKQPVCCSDKYVALDGVRSRYSGRHIFIELRLGVDAQKPLGEIQCVMDRIEQDLEKEIQQSEVTVVPRAL